MDETDKFNIYMYKNITKWIQTHRYLESNYFEYQRQFEEYKLYLVENYQRRYNL